MPTTGSYELLPAKFATPNGVIDDENKIGRGEWAWIDRSSDERRWLSIYIRCPDCGFLASIWRSFGNDTHGHQIDAQGNVSPSIGCPHAPCEFHTQPTRLAGFTDRRST